MLTLIHQPWFVRSARLVAELHAERTDFFPWVSVFLYFERSSRTFVRFRSSRLPQPARSVQFEVRAAFVRVRSSRNPRERQRLNSAEQAITHCPTSGVVVSSCQPSIRDRCVRIFGLCGITLSLVRLRLRPLTALHRPLRMSCRPRGSGPGLNSSLHC